MARTYPLSDPQDPAIDPQPGEWQALRGELVALLDQVEGRFPPDEAPKTAYEGLTQRVRNLRDQVDGTTTNARHREALKTVKRAVDRFSVRDEVETGPGIQDNLQSAIAEIRNRQTGAPSATAARRVVEMPQFGELTALVGGLSSRLERLEGELKSQRANNGNVREVASQVEQLAQVVELLAGAVGETGQVKRLEAQIAGLARMMGEAPKVDLSTINQRLDDVSATVGKLAELQAQQMEREVARQDRDDDVAMAGVGQVAEVGESMHAIEKSVRNVYDRIDSIERNVTLSSSDFERLTAEMSAFTQAVRDKEAVPSKLVAKIDALQARIGSFENVNGDIAGLKSDIAALRDVVLSGVEPRFDKLESQLEALSVKLDQPRADDSGVGEIENQLKVLVARMDETGAQLNGLTKLYSAPVTGAAAPEPDFEALATMVATRTFEAARQQAPDATNGLDQASINALEQRMSALFNTAGKDTAERLARLETALAKRTAEPTGTTLPASPAKPVAATAMPAPVAPTELPALPAEDIQALDTMLEALSAPRAGKSRQSDAMPANPADDVPLRDAGFADIAPRQATVAPRGGNIGAGAQSAAKSAAKVPAVADAPMVFDAASAERPPRPQSSFDQAGNDPFAEVRPHTGRKSDLAASAAAANTSTFVAAARRAQRAKQEAAPVAVSNSIIGRALARVKANATEAAAAKAESAKAEAPMDELAVAAPEGTEKKSLFGRKPKLPKAAQEPQSEPLMTFEAQEPVVPVMAETPRMMMDEDEAEEPGFLTRYRRTLLLAAALGVVSLLALNLVMRHADTPAAPAAATPAKAEAQKTSMLGDNIDPASLPTEPRVIAMMDSSTVGSIDPTSTSRFTKPAPVTPMPPTLLASAGTAPAAAPDADMVTGSLPPTAVGVAEFALAPETLGPLPLRQAAADGDARAQFEIGAIYSEGRAVPQDFAAAATWYERAASQGFVPAEYRLGNLYESGNGVKKDLEQAKLWYQRGAEAGNRMAMHNLAALYAGGELGEQKFEAAAEWFEQAADRGMTDSQFNLGMLHARGLGVEQDLKQSFKWFSLAARNGDADAAKARDDIARSLDADAVKAMKADVDAWKPTPIDLAANFAPIGTWSPSFDPGEAITTKDVISKVQNVLLRLGYDIGSPDGVVGPKTADAIKAFERGTGMSETGTINPRLLAVLGSQPV